MVHNKALVLTDNEHQYNKFYEIITKFDILKKFDFFKSGNSNFPGVKINSLDIKKDYRYVIDNYDIVFSLHCKQLFPEKLVNNITCINIHPGYNPYNRGWYPQVFSIIEDNIIGATIHLMDKELDNGFIIARKEVEKFFWDTSETLYSRILQAEVDLINDNLLDIMNDNYCPFPPEVRGELKLKKDFNELCRIDLERVGSFKEFYNYLRALSHNDFKNAYFVDNKTNKKVYLKLFIEVYNND